MESTLDYKVKWVGTEPIEEGVKVKSSARSVTKKRQPPITIDYSMRPAENEWKVYDIFTDEVSLVKNYKRQFRRVIKEEGWKGGWRFFVTERAEDFTFTPSSRGSVPSQLTL